MKDDALERRLGIRLGRVLKDESQVLNDDDISRRILRCICVILQERESESDLKFAMPAISGGG